MQSFRLLLACLVVSQLLACNQEKNLKDHKQVITVSSKFIVEEDDIEPPPPDLTHRFATMSDWLTHIIDHDTPDRKIAKYNLVVFETENVAKEKGYSLCLTGENTYNVNDTLQKVRIEFTPAEMYFTLPEKEHEGLTRTQVFEKLTAQVNQFINTRKFKNSYLARARNFTTSWNGKIYTPE